MTTDADFMTAILAAPADAALRLIFADWLEQQGDDARSEFIRVQCELATLGGGQIMGHGGCGNPRCKECNRRSLRRRERESCMSIRKWTDDLPGSWHSWEWVPEVSVRKWDQLNPPTWRYTFRRGFVAAVSCRLEDWCGRTCEQCNGGLWRGVFDSTDGYCPACHGTGLVGGHGRSVAAAQPVEEVRTTDWSDHSALDCLVPYLPKGWFDDSHRSAALLAWAKSMNLERTKA